MFYWRKISILLFFGLILAAVPSVLALIKPGFFVSDDGIWMVIRFTAFFDSLKDGQIPVRMLERLNSGYGYPVANFLYPGFLYIASIIHITGFGFVDSIKILLALSMVLSGVWSYLWLRKLFDPIASFVGGIFYIYTPYHLYDLYVRGSVGEVLALSFVPFILWQIERKSIPFIAFGVFLLIISHNTIALLTLPVVFLYAVFRGSKINSFIGMLWGVAMSSFFVVPALMELKYTRFKDVDISNPLEYFADLNLIGMSTIVLFVAVAFFIIFYFRGALKLLPYKTLFFIFMTFGILGIFLSSSISAVVWGYLPSSFVQFPFRLLSVLLLSVAFVSAYLFDMIEKRGLVKWIIGGVLLGVLVYSSTAFLFPKETVNYEEGYYTTNTGATTVRDEYLPTWVKTKPDKNFAEKVIAASGSPIIKNIKTNSRRIEFDLEESINTVVRVNQIYYPGWNAYMNSQKLKINYDNEYGVMDIPVVRPGGKIIVVFNETPLRFFSNTVTVLAIVGAFLFLLRPVLKFK